MAEYLSPGVYVEEFDSGSKPMEGVSTSTCLLYTSMEKSGNISYQILEEILGKLNPVDKSGAYGVHCRILLGYLMYKKGKFIEDVYKRQVMASVPYTRINGHREQRLSNNVNFAFQFIEGESLLIMLDMAGICGSSGSACTSGSLDPSHVLLAIGLPHEIAHGSLRLSLNEENTKEEMDYVAEKIKEIVERLRNM